MASSTGPKIAAPQIFTSDPLEQAYAKGTLDPDMGGLAYAFMNAARGRREEGQQQYMGALRESNMLAARLAAHESEQELLGKALTSQAEMANAGIDPNLMPINQKLYGTNFGSTQVGLPSSLSRDVKLTQAEKNRADAAHARAAGADAGGVQVTGTQDYGSSGVVGDERMVFKGKDQAAVQRAMAADRARRAQGGGGAAPSTTTTIRPDGSVGPKTTAEMRNDARDANLITQRLNDKDAKYRDR